MQSYPNPIAPNNSANEHFQLPLLEWCWIPPGQGRIGKWVTSVDGFYMSKYPVTFAQYDTFIKDGGYEEVSYWTGWGWRWKNESPEPPKEDYYDYRDRYSGDQPVKNISWYEAIAFSRWLSTKIKATVTLPHEFQWARAYNGGDNRLYPWGNNFSIQYANTYESAIKAITPVNKYPQGASPFGVCDMLGNLTEWMSTPNIRDDNAIPNFKLLRYINLEGSSKRQVKGLSYDKEVFSPTGQPRTVTGAGGEWEPETKSPFIGFRVIIFPVSKSNSSNGEKPKSFFQRLFGF